jgi:hypothetical protein
MSLNIPVLIRAYIYQPQFGDYTATKNYKHHYCCGLCGNEIARKFGNRAVFEHIEQCHSDKLLLLEEDTDNSEYTKLLNEQDKLEFMLHQLEVIESSLNGMYKGIKHPRFNAILLQDNKQMIKYQMAKIKQQILSYDLNHNTFIPIMEYENLTTEI